MTMSTDLCYENGRGGANTKKNFVFKENKNSYTYSTQKKGLLALAENDTIGWQKKHTRLAN